jgi:succinyl-CoA synthetase beta subunit
MVKAQVHVGGRGKAGGVKYCPTPEAAREKAQAILGMDIKGLTVEKVLVTEAADIGTEAYVGIIVDRATKKAVFMVSAAGGIDIEEVAATTPEKIKYFRSTRATVSLLRGAAARLLPVSGRQAGARRGQDHAAAVQGVRRERLLARRDQPARRDARGEVIAVDAKMVIDDNELERRRTSRRCATRARGAERGGRAQREPHVHQARRQRRLHRERRRARRWRRWTW